MAGSSMVPPHVQAYLDRIGYAGALPVTFDTLRDLHQHHIRAIPFETLAMLTRQPISLRLDDLRTKVIHDRRGGYCYELNLLFLDLLRTLGFEARGLTGRVLLGASDGTDRALESIVGRSP